MIVETLLNFVKIKKESLYLLSYVAFGLAYRQALQTQSKLSPVTQSSL